MTPWRTISVALKADPSGIVAGTATGSAAIKKFGDTSETSLARHNASVAKTGSTWTTIAKGIAGGLAVIGIALGLSLHEAIAWESAFAGVAKTVDGTTGQLSALEDGLLSLANRLPATRTEIAGVAEAAGALGIQRGAILGFTETMIGLGEATNLTADEAATMLAQFANIMGTSQGEFESLADTLVNLGNNGASTEKEILDLALRLAGAGRTIGLTENQVFALANAMASMGIDAQLGGGALSRVMRNIEVAVADGGERLTGFAEASGMSAAAFAEQWKADPAAALTVFLESMKDLQDAGGNMYGVLADLGIKGTQDVDVIGRLISGSDGLAASFRDSEDAAGSLATEVEKRYATAESQLKVFRNRVTDVARVVGASLIPMMLGALKAAEAFGRWLITTGAAAAERLSGAWDDLGDAGGNIVELLSSLWEAGKPVVTLFAQIGGGIAIASLTQLASLLESTTGFLADHEELVIAIGVAYAGWKAIGAVQSLSSLFVGLISQAAKFRTAVVATEAASALGSIARGAADVARNMFAVPDASARMTDSVQGGFTQMATGANGLASSIGGVNGALIGVSIGAALAFRAAERGAEAAKKRADEFVESLQIDPNDPRSVVSGMEEISNRMEKLREQAEDQSFEVFGISAAGIGKNTIDRLNPFNTNEIQDARDELERLAEVSGNVHVAFIRNAAAVAGFAKESRISIPEVREIAQRAGIDISTAFDDNGKANRELQAEIDRTAKVAEDWGITTSDAAQMSSEELQLVEEQVKRIADAGDAARTAWASWSDVLQVTDDPVDQDAVERSSEMVEDARERVRQAEKEAQAGGQSATEAERSAQALRDARDALVDATEAHSDLLGADSPLNAGKVQQFYADRLAQAQEFSANLNTAIEAGYDPALLSRLMQAGPEQAGPVLAALVEDTSAAYVESINAAEEALDRFNVYAVRQAQLTQRAIELGTGQAAQDLGLANQIAQISLDHPELNGNQIADLMHIELEDAQRVIDEFQLGVRVFADSTTAEDQVNAFTNERREAIIGVGLDEEGRDRTERRLEVLAREREARIRVVAITDPESQKIIDALSLGATLAGLSGTYGDHGRWGLVTSYAAGGIHRQAMIGNGRGRVHWDEPETGGEAYVPRFGNRWRSISILGEAAGWFGMGLVPKAQNQVPPRPVPFGGALVPGGGHQQAEFGGRRPTEVHFHKVTNDDRWLTREAQRMGVYG